jgi:hypothetical protein
VTITVPAGWTAPVTTAAIGCTSATVGTITTSVQTITVSNLTLAANVTTAVTYGATSGGSCTTGDGATAPSTSGPQTWQGKEKSTSGGVLANISSPSITVNSATPVSATLTGSTTDSTTGTKTTTVSSVPTANGATELIVVYRESSISSETITSITGPFSGTPTSITTNQDFNSKHNLYSWRATGNGSTANVVVTFSGNNKNVLTVVDVVEVAGNDTTTPIAQSTTNTANSATATTTLTSPTAGNGEVDLIAATTNTTVNTPAGFTQVATASGSTGTGYSFKVAFDATAQASASSTLGASNQWGTIGLEIKHS